MGNLINKKDLNTIVCYGDSITYGLVGKVIFNTQSESNYPEVLNTLFNDEIKVINSGNSGWQVHNAIDGFEANVLEYNPDLVLIMFGINDMLGSFIGGNDKTIKDYIEDMDNLINLFKEYNIDFIILSPTYIKDIELKEYVVALEEYSRENKYSFINVYNYLKKYIISNNLEEKIYDGIHYESELYEKLAEYIYSKI